MVPPREAIGEIRILQRQVRGMVLSRIGQLRLRVKEAVSIDKPLEGSGGAGRFSVSKKRFTIGLIYEPTRRQVLRGMRFGRPHAELPAPAPEWHD